MSDTGRGRGVIVSQFYWLSSSSPFQINTAMVSNQRPPVLASSCALRRPVVESAMCVSVCGHALYVCLWACVCVCLWACVCVCLWACVSVCLWACVHSRICSRAHLFARALIFHKYFSTQSGSLGELRYYEKVFHVYLY